MPEENSEKSPGKSSSALVATVGLESQVVTITLDLLLEMGEKLEEVVAMHTSMTHTQAGMESIRRLDEEFVERKYYGPGISYRREVLRGPSGPMQDITTEEEAGWAFSMLYKEVLHQKRGGRRVHLCIAGGRKSVVVYGMAVAQLIFDDDDRLWHLISGEDYIASRRMHARPGSTHLIRIPILRWSATAPIMTELAMTEDPFEAIQRQREMKKEESLRMKHIFTTQTLSRAERPVAEMAAREGLTNSEIAQKLHRSPKTIANQLGSIYNKLSEFLGYDRDRVGRHTLISELAPYYQSRAR